MPHLNQTNTMQGENKTVDLSYCTATAYFEDFYRQHVLNVQTSDLCVVITI